VLDLVNLNKTLLLGSSDIMYVFVHGHHILVVLEFADSEFAHVWL
jgi:hypothetical protein